MWPFFFHLIPLITTDDSDDKAVKRIFFTEFQTNQVLSKAIFLFCRFFGCNKFNNRDKEKLVAGH
jgi:hypothetical protein